MASELTKEVSKRKIDPFTTFVPFGCVLALCAYFVLAPENSTNALEVIRSFLGDKCGVYYLVIGLGFTLAFVFQDRQAHDWQEGRKAEIRFLCMGSNGLHMRTGIGHPVLFFL